MKKIKLIIDGKEIDAEIDEKQLEKKEVRKRAGKGDDFFYISGVFSVETHLEDENCSHHCDIIYKTGNYFLSREEAKKEAEKRYEYAKAITKIKDYIKENGMVFEPDWKDINQYKYTIYYNNTNSIFKCWDNCINQQFSILGYLKSSIHAQRLIKDCEKELKIIFNIK